MQLCRIFFVRPLFGITLDKFWAGFLSVGLNAGSYGAELVRGAILPVPKGQWEACRALNMSTRTYVRIVIPQAPPTSVAGMGNDLVGIFKETPMLSVIGVAELMHTASAIGAENHRFPEPYTLVGVISLAISLPVAGFVRLFEAWVRRKLGLR